MKQITIDSKEEIMEIGLVMFVAPITVCVILKLISDGLDDLMKWLEKEN